MFGFFANALYDDDDVDVKRSSITRKTRLKYLQEKYPPSQSINQRPRNSSFFLVRNCDRFLVPHCRRNIVVYGGEPPTGLVEQVAQIGDCAFLAVEEAHHLVVRAKTKKKVSSVDKTAF